jgi:hypothetical protein
VKNTSSANAAVTMMWLVTEKVYGIMLITFATRTKMKMEYTSGKNLIPSSPALERIMLATNT